MKKTKIKKLDRIKNNLEINKSIMKCPKCHNKFSYIAGNSIICSENHSFDIAKKGYINLLKSNKSDIYNRDLFESRNRVFVYGVYNSLFKEISSVVLHHIKDKSNSCILDAGSGEGYFLNYLSKIVTISENSKIFGLDISKEALKIASMGEEDIVWCVSDLSNIPIKDNQLDVILNILSPANYNEFKRILNPQGIVIKVIPEVGYLKEIRENLLGYIEKDV